MKSNSTLMMALGAILAFFGPLDGKPAVMVEGLLSLGEEAHAPAKDNESYCKKQKTSEPTSRASRAIPIAK